jgi:hypothetical protein
VSKLLNKGGNLFARSPQKAGTFFSTPFPYPLIQIKLAIMARHSQAVIMKTCREMAFSDKASTFYGGVESVNPCAMLLDHPQVKGKVLGQTKRVY